MKLQTRLIIIICSLLLFVIVFLSFLFQHMFAATLKEQIGMRALNVAETVAATPLVRDAFRQPDPHRQIQPFADCLKHELTKNPNASLTQNQAVGCRSNCLMY